MSADKFKVKIENGIMFAKKVKLCPSVRKVLENATAKYPICRVVCKTVTVPIGYRDVSHEKLFSRQLPTRIVIGLISTEGFNGAFTRNPLNFRHFNLMEISVYSDGQQQCGIKPLTTDFANDVYERAYNTLFSETGMVLKDSTDWTERRFRKDMHCMHWIRRQILERTTTLI